MQVRAGRGVDEGARLGCKAAEVGVLHEAAGLRAQVVLGEVRQGAPLEAKGYPLALHVLLPHAGNHLHTTVSTSGGALGMLRIRQNSCDDSGLCQTWNFQIPQTVLLDFAQLFRP